MIKDDSSCCLPMDKNMGDGLCMMGMMMMDLLSDGWVDGVY